MADPQKNSERNTVSLKERLSRRKRLLLLVSALFILILNGIMIDWVIYGSTHHLADQETPKEDPAPKEKVLEEDIKEKEEIPPEKEKPEKIEEADKRETLVEEIKNQVLSRVELAGLVRGGRQKGAVTEEDWAVMQREQDYAILKVDGDRTVVTTGDSILELWEVKKIKPDYILLAAEKEELNDEGIEDVEVKVSFYK